MNLDIFRSVIESPSKHGTAFTWDAPSHHHIRLWWQGAYAEVIERDHEYVERYNIADRTAPGAIPVRFHKVDRRPKGEHQYTDQRTANSVTFILKRLVEMRTATKFLSDPTFGLLALGPELASMCHWEGWASLDLFGRRETNLSLIGMPEGPTAIQRQWYTEFQQRQDGLQPAIEAAIFASYKEMLSRTDEELPIRTATDVQGYIDPAGFHVTSSTDDPEDLETLVAELHWDTAWDEEHGITVRVNRDFTVFDVE